MEDSLKSEGENNTIIIYPGKRIEYKGVEWEVWSVCDDGNKLCLYRNNKKPHFKQISLKEVEI